MATKLTTEEFVKNANSLHNHTYNYSKVDYINSRTKVIINCSKHGDFKQRPTRHMSGDGCPICAIERSRINNRLTTDEFIHRAILKHSTDYDYTLTNYIDSNTKVSILCKVHGEFKQTAGNHLQGDGCPSCAKENRGYSRTTWKAQGLQSKNFDSFKLYLIRVFSLNTGEEFYKIGITFLAINRRFNNGNSNKLPYSYEVIDTIEGSPEYIYDKENELHRIYKHLTYTPNIEFKGSGECYTINKTIKLK